MKEQSKPPQRKIISEFFENQVFDKSEVYISTPIFIVTTEDKIHRCLLDYSKNLSEGGNSWHTPLGIFITIAATFAISTFKTTFGVPPEIWSVIFIIVGTIAFYWFITSYLRTIKSKKIEIEDIVVQLKDIKK